MSQNDPKKVKTIRDDVDYGFYGIVEVNRYEINGIEPMEHMRMFGKGGLF